MDNRERMLKTLGFLGTDRIPLVEWPIREATMREWVRQGYPEGTEPEDFFSLDAMYHYPPVQMGMIPPYKPEIMEQDGVYKIWRDELGAVRKDFLENKTPGFVTRSWLKFPVESREDFLEIRKRFDPGLSTRYIGNFRRTVDAPTHLSIPFLFWTARDWMGFEGLCCAFHDQPALVGEMFEHICGFALGLLKNTLEKCRVDTVELKEDMAYKGAPMIGPDMFRKFMLPHYKKFISTAKSSGVSFVFVDCDGYPGKLIPLWMEAGIDGMSPCEIAAGNDILGLRKAYPRFHLWGGIDKRVLSQGKDQVRTEVMSKVPEMIEKGGYIPHVDHAVPADAKLENYIYFRELLREITLK